MTYIIPVSWNVEYDNPIQRDGYFFRKGIIENHSEFQKLGIKKKTLQHILEIIATELKQQAVQIKKNVGSEEIASKIFEYADIGLDDALENLLRSLINDMYVTVKEPPGVVFSIGSNSCMIISKDKESAIKINKRIEAKFFELGNTTQDFGLKIQQYTSGDQFAYDQIRQSREEIQTFQTNSPKNTFEQEVLNEVHRITNCLLSNVVIQFSSPMETNEYDILIPIPNGSILYIEVTNYETAKKEIHKNQNNLKSQLILATLDKSRRLPLKCIIICKGFPDDTFDSMKEVANSRNIILLSAQNYKDSLPNIIFSEFLDRRNAGRLGFQRRQVLRRNKK